ncbi:LuxR family transcriptional regulator [Hyphomonas jannaschiana VP2]|uniref:LuxR family transcriptional regulator n=1 Tax=Hyphomonas jannaschiana VP2 TaxID=1280952 RepID=A0A059FKK4_9PROT|nr:LuxR family transcriptional regulator [Hyphomonas jannaschiana VP2]
MGVAVLFGTIALFIGADLITDSGEGAGAGHLAAELFVLVAASFGLGAMLWRLGRLRRALADARQDAGRWQAENRDLVQGLGVAIARQFSAWGLTDAESDVGLLLLKGLSLQEIADLRETSERTVREQARAVYRKSSLAGRNALSAYFLEDLLPGSGG